MARDNKERFGNKNKANPNWIRLKDDVLSYRDQFTGEPSWPKPQDFAETYGYKNFETTEFRTRYNKTKEELMGEFFYFDSYLQ